MASEYTETTEFPVGTDEAYVKARKALRDSRDDVKSCEYVQNADGSFTMTTIYIIPD